MIIDQIVAATQNYLSDGIVELQEYENIELWTPDLEVIKNKTNAIFLDTFQIRF